MEHIKTDLLNPEQKKLKQKIMEELMAVIPRNVASYINILDVQAGGDLITSILIMFMRDNILLLIKAIDGREPQMKIQFIETILNIIRNEVLTKLRNEKLQ